MLTATHDSSACLTQKKGRKTCKLNWKESITLNKYSNLIYVPRFTYLNSIYVLCLVLRGRSRSEVVVPVRRTGRLHFDESSKLRCQKAEVIPRLAPANWRKTFDIFANFIEIVCASDGKSRLYEWLPSVP